LEGSSAVSGAYLGAEDEGVAGLEGLMQMEAVEFAM
jgi:hypothetical protein